MWFPLILTLFATVNGDQQPGELLCRQCGATITRRSELLNLTGVDESQKRYEYDFPLAGKTTKVHVLQNPEGHKFHVFGAKTAHLLFHGDPQSRATFYPGYQWTVCMCKACSRHMGWYFEPIGTVRNAPKHDEVRNPDVLFIEDENWKLGVYSDLLTKSGEEQSTSPRKSFVGLILDNVISAEYVDSLIKSAEF